MTMEWTTVVGLMLSIPLGTVCLYLFSRAIWAAYYRSRLEYEQRSVSVKEFKRNGR